MNYNHIVKQYQEKRETNLLELIYCHIQNDLEETAIK